MDASRMAEIATQLDRAVDVAAGDSIIANFEGLGSVTVRFV
jgi:2-keto-4-pentenoate hydratase